MAANMPFIIWTLRRTGGTNLAKALFSRSACPSVQHEPFNTDRLYGAITQAWLRDHDRAALDRGLDQLCAGKPLLKHCVEIMPRALNDALVEATLKNGYRHLFLYRRNPLDRLLSLHFASRSGIWGKRPASEQVLDEAFFAAPLPIAKLLAHEKQCRLELEHLYEQICRQGQRPLVVAFEELYGDAPEEDAQRRVISLFERLHLAFDPAGDAGFLRTILDKGDQGTRDRYRQFRDYDRLAVALDGLEEFSLAGQPRYVVRVAEKLPDGVEFAEVWQPKATASGEQVNIEGVFLAQQAGRLLLRTPYGERPAQQALPSPNLARRLADKPAAAKARFRIQRSLPTRHALWQVIWQPEAGVSGQGGTHCLADIEVTPAAPVL